MTPQVFQFDEELAPAGSIYWESRVLVVGDDDLASKLSAVLRVARGSVVVASDGAAGLRLLTSTHEFTLALVDLLRIDATLVRQFRTWEAHEGAARARVVAVSHNAANVHREQVLEAGFDDVLLVPTPVLASHARPLSGSEDSA